MPSVTASPSTFASHSDFGTIEWLNPANASSSNNTYASTTVTIGGGTTQYLSASGFGFSIPDNAIINGIQVDVERKANANEPLLVMFVTDARVRLMKAGVVQQADKADTSTRWPTSDGIATYGSASALWDEGEVGFSSWTASDINNSGFGVVIASTISDASEEGFVISSIDHIQVTVTYTILLEVNTCWPLALYIVAQRSRHKARQKDESDKRRSPWR